MPRHRILQRTKVGPFLVSTVLLPAPESQWHGWPYETIVRRENLGYEGQEFYLQRARSVRQALGFHEEALTLLRVKRFGELPPGTAEVHEVVPPHLRSGIAFEWRQLDRHAVLVRWARLRTYLYRQSFDENDIDQRFPDSTSYGDHLEAWFSERNRRLFSSGDLELADWYRIADEAAGHETWLYWTDDMWGDDAE